MTNNLNTKRAAAAKPKAPSASELLKFGSKPMPPKQKEIVHKFLYLRPITNKQREDKPTLVHTLTREAVRELVKHDARWDYYLTGDGKHGDSCYSSLYNLIRNSDRVNGPTKRTAGGPDEAESPRKMSLRSSAKKQKLQETPKFGDDEPEPEEESIESEQEEASYEEEGEESVSEEAHSQITEIRAKPPMAATATPEVREPARQDVRAPRFDDAAYLNQQLTGTNVSVGDITFCHQQYINCMNQGMHWRAKVHELLNILRHHLITDTTLESEEASAVAEPKPLIKK